jgi:hypothetical protein
LARQRPGQITNALTEKHAAANSHLAEFVGLKAYEQPGGAVLRDRATYSTTKTRSGLATPRW